jgi:preprotein translocase subunit YajC
MVKRLLSLSLLLSSAPAFAEGGASQGNPMGQILILGVFVFFLFWMMRAQSKRTKDHQKLIGAITKGDEVVTSGGLLGKITKVSDTFFAVQLADGIEVFVQKSMIANSVPKGTMRSV